MAHTVKIAFTAHTAIGVAASTGPAHFALGVGSK